MNDIELIEARIKASMMEAADKAFSLFDFDKAITENIAKIYLEGFKTGAQTALKFINEGVSELS